MICIDAMWLAADPIDMRAGAERLLSRVVQVFGAAQAHHGYLFANARGTRVKLLVHDGFGVWCAARRLNAGRFVWPGASNATPLLSLTPAQFDALVLGLPWQRLPELSTITRALGPDTTALAYVTVDVPMASSPCTGIIQRMLGARDLPAANPSGLSAETTALVGQLLQRLQDQEQQLAEHGRVLAQRDQALAERDALLQRKDREVALREAKIEKITFELAKLKRWKFGAKSEAINAEQRRLFEETLAEDEAGLREQLERLRREAAAAAAAAATSDTTTKAPPRRPRRNPFPDRLRRVEHHHEPERTDCQEPGCGRPMKRIGEEVSERLDIVPAEFFVHRHIYGKWACRCCQVLRQAPSVAEVIEGGIAASGFVAHTLISRFVDHMPYYRQATINARSGVHTPRSTLASITGQAGAALEPLHEAHRRFILSCAVLHADETPVAPLDPGAGKTRRAYVWATPEAGTTRCPV
jgi:transposase